MTSLILLLWRHLSFYYDVTNTDADSAKKIKNSAVINESPTDKLIRELKVSDVIVVGVVTT